MTQRTFSFDCPSAWYNPGAVEEALTRLGDGRFSLQVGREHLSLNGRSPTPDMRARVRRVFAALNGVPAYEAGHTPAPARRPVVSCIILVHGNELFVRDVLIPSIVANTPAGSYEIIVVYNGFGTTTIDWPRMKCVTAEIGCPAAGYNRGAECARGEFVAIFHDDCLLEDSQWLDKCRSALDERVIAVTPEADTTMLPGIRIAKCVPLFARRERFFAIGAFDETYYVGLEDADFSCRVTAAGLRIDRVRLAYRHFRGMSTIVALSANARLFKKMFALHLMPARVVERAQHVYMARLHERLHRTRLRREFATRESLRLASLYENARLPARTRNALAGVRARAEELLGHTPPRFSRKLADRHVLQAIYREVFRPG